MTNVKPIKKTLGRRKIQLKKIENKSNLQVTFTKRRTGLFKKASELSVLCGAEIAILVQSPANKIFSFGNPSVLHRYQTGFWTTELEIEDNNYTRNEYDEAVQKLEMKKKSLMDSSSSWKTENRFWWDATSQLENMEELEEYMEALEGLRSNVLHRVDDQEQKIAEYANDLASCCFSSSNLLPPEFCKNCDFNYPTSDSQFQFINGSVEDFDVSSFLDILDLDIADLNYKGFI